MTTETEVTESGGRFRRYETVADLIPFLEERIRVAKADVIRYDGWLFRLKHDGKIPGVSGVTQRDARERRASASGEVRAHERTLREIKTGVVAK